MTSALRSRYALGEPLGSGSVGVVYRASESGGPELAIKVLDQELADDPRVLGRASKESSKLRAVRDPHLVVMKDLEIKADRVAIVMELLSGGTLADYLLLRGKVPTREALSITRQILSGLAAAHSGGLTHGRVTPQNILLTSTAKAGPLTVKVSDYATFRLISGTEAAAEYCLTPYVAPEILSGEAATPASDLFSVGVILYELLTGELPTAQPLRRPAHIAPALWHVVIGWLSPRPARRAANTWAALKSIETLRGTGGPSRREQQQLPLAQQPSTAVPPLLAKKSNSSTPSTYVPVLTKPDVLEVIPDRLEVVQDLLEVVPDRPVVAPEHLEVVPDLLANTSDLSVVASEVSLLKAPTRPVATSRFAPATLPKAPPRFSPPPPADPEPEPEPEYGSSEPPPPVERRRRHWSARSRWLSAAAAFVVLAVAGGSVYGLTSSSTHIKSFSYNFAVENTPQNDTQVQRSWTLTGGAHPVLHADLEFLAKGAGAATVDELLPTSLLSSATSVAFNPQPQKVDGNHVVSYSFGTGSNRVINASYDVAVPANLVSEQTLKGWVQQQQEQTGALYREGHKLASISAPTTITLAIGKTSTLAVGGKLADGTSAPSVALDGATYTIDDTKIATVASDGRVTGKHAGKTKVHVKLGTLSATSNVVVLAPKKTATKNAPAIVTPNNPASTNTSLTTTAPGTTQTNTNTNTNPDTGTVPPVTPPTTPVKVIPPVTPTHPATGPTKPPATTPTTPAGGGGGGATTPPAQPTGGPTSAPPVIQPTGTLPIIING